MSNKDSSSASIKSFVALMLLLAKILASSAEIPSISTKEVFCHLEGVYTDSLHMRLFYIQ